MFAKNIRVRQGEIIKRVFSYGPIFEELITSHRCADVDLQVHLKFHGIRIENTRKLLTLTNHFNFIITNRRFQGSLQL